ncbi:hypothetical protein KO507_01805 [Gilvimarinus agarilyticus]|uniref:YbbR-like protein n=1 Tax=Reichenbachiella agariperforans TaxID=156994 RepID=A0A1M6WAQ3_REIAG|nr:MULTISPECIES: hypothetical protein [Reichenbachiella]MBU2884495.1 hypothetical protein [Gilvimarinus agarilyticus]MBU2915176.1 hypothetical protein [Reichenbachiella agariperforans]RJE70328.1 hypothetical protein BGP76_09510 [Reichenbachiella sp. MSK19-1]SHK90814.1 hypothetical protein SAMN04488028_11123 [Reichenbachiella agariperforans]
MSLFRFFAPGLKENWKVVLLSILGATTFWFFNAMNKSYSTRLDYPIAYEFNQDSVVVVDPLVKNVKIVVTSGGWNLLRKTLRINATPILVPLDNPTEIRFLTRSSLVPMISEQLDGLKLTYVVTDTLFFNIQEKVTKKLAIQVDSINIPLKDSYRLTSRIRIANDSATFSGPKSYMDSLDQSVLIRFTDKNIDSNFDEELGYQLDKIVKSTQKETNVKFDVARFLYKDITIPIEFLHFPEDSSAVASQSDIKIYYTINENFEDEVSESDFSVTVDYTMMNDRDSTITPILMYAHDKALDIVLALDKLSVEFPPASFR